MARRVEVRLGPKKTLAVPAVAMDEHGYSPKAGPVCCRETQSGDLLNGRCGVCCHPFSMHPGPYTNPKAEGCLMCILTNITGQDRARCQQVEVRVKRQCLRGWGHELFGEKHQYVVSKYRRGSRGDV